MNVLIVAKTRRGSRACVGGITAEGQSVRLVAINEATDDRAGMEYEVGEVWAVEATPAPSPTPPHVEDVIVGRKRRLRTSTTLVSAIERLMPPKAGGREALYEGLTQATRAGVLYIAERTGVPPYSTQFWRPDRPLYRDEDAKRIRYRYPTEDGGFTLTFVGFQEPVEVIPAGTLLRVSMSRWWRPKEKPDGELRCYIQLSGWFDNAEAVEPGVQQTRGTTDLTTHASLQASQKSAMDEAGRLLKTVFGYDTFRPLQAEIIANVLGKRDTLVIMPTGGGKSLCYQLPALIFDGLTVVISPLIALMQDQVMQLREMGVAAVFLNSTLDYHTYRETAQQVRQGDVKLLYVAPETLLRPETLAMLDQSNVECLTIDEAHCISSWGHDFRPEYRQLMPVRERYPRAVSIALTATATPRVQRDIIQSLGVGASDTFIASFDRPNLFLEVQPRTDGLNQVLTFLDSHRDQSGIIYCSTRKQVDALSNQLNLRGWPALPYHAGMDAETRRRNQERFVRDDVPIMVATIAFGMGINKSNVRFILHYNLPQNIESYYQQIGRAGRDGLRADCLLLYSGADVGTIYHFIYKGAESEQAGRTARLQAMVRYAETRDCRRGPLLSYFGEARADHSCEACDNCLGDAEDVETVDVTIPAQKFLSCVKRTGEIFGITHVIDVLRGSKNQKVLGRGHDRLSTYGIGQEHSTAEWKRLAQHFIQQGLLKQDMKHGGVSLTATGWEVLRGSEKVFVAAPSTTRQAGPEAADYDKILFEQLRKLRKTLADAEGAPPYMVFSDRALVEMATYFPQSTPAFMAINGVGEVKMGKYGQPFQDAIRAYCVEQGLQKRAKPTAPQLGMSTSRGEKRRFEEVGELFADGHSVDELQAVYGVKRGTIINNLTTYLRAGGRVDPQRVRTASALSPAQQEQVLAQLDELGANALRPVFDAFDGTVPYDELHIMRLYYLCAADGAEA